MEKPITFAGFPLCTNLDKLNADVAIIGIPYGTPYDASQPPNSLHAADAIREESMRYPDDRIAWDFDLGGTLEGDTGVRVADCGNLNGSQTDPEGNRASAKSAIKAILDAGAIPIVIGGDDSIPIPVMRAYDSQEPFYVLQLDAHIDWRDQLDGIREGYSSTMRRASEMPWVRGIVQVGMRGVGSARKEEYQAALDYGARLITVSEIEKKGIGIVLNELPEGSRCFITLDLDALDPSTMPAVDALAPGGLNYLDVVELFQSVMQKTQVVGVCIIALVPEMDVNAISTITTMRIVWNAIGGMARAIKW